MSETRITAYANALLSIGAAENSQSEMEDELFRFSRSLEANDELRSVLADPHIPAARRQQIVEDLLGGKATTATVASVSMIVGAGRIGELPKIVEEVVARSASNRGEQVAEVRSAVPLTKEQQDRLVVALQARTNVPVTIRNIVDPTVLGGIVTTIGDSVLDGSIRTRLSQLRDAF